MKKYIGKLVRVVFWDHTYQSRILTKCEVAGRLLSEDDQKIVVSNWTVLSGDADMVATNEECCAIVRGAIISIRNLH